MYASGNGGALFNTLNDTKVESSEFKGNSAINGGAIANFYDHGKTTNYGSITITDSQFEGNKAVASDKITEQFDSGFGGAVYAYIDARATDSNSSVVIKNSSFTQNSAVNGGAIANRAQLTVSDSTFTGNTASEKGGAIYNAASLTLSGTNTFDGNTAAGTANDIHNEGTVTVAGGVTDLNSGYTQEGAASELNVAAGGTLSIAMPDKGGVTAGSGEALLALGQQIDLSKGGSLHVGTVSNADAAVAFGSDSILVVNGDVSTQKAMIKGSGSLAVDDGAKLYITNAKAGTKYIITEGLSQDSYWKSANLMANRLIKSTVLASGNQVIVNSEADQVVVNTDPVDAATALPGVIPATALTNMVAQGLNNTDSDSMGIRFLSRAIEPLYIADDRTAVLTINEVSRAAVMAGVQNTSLRLADAASDKVLHHLSLGNFDSGNSIHKDGIDVWATPMYGNTYSHGMTVSDDSVVGNYGGLAIGADTEIASFGGGTMRLGLAVHGGAGHSESQGAVTSTDNSYNFGGANIYAGWNRDSLNIMASVGYSVATHKLNMDLPSSLEMGDADADVHTGAFTAELRGEYQFRTDWLDIMPHTGVRYTALHTYGYDLEVDDRTLNSVDDDIQNIVQFPTGVTLTKNFTTSSGWNIKPQFDASIIPAVGDLKTNTKVRYSGIDAEDSIHNSITDTVSWAGMAGIQFEKGDFAFGANYAIQAAAHETDQRVALNFVYKF